MGDSAALNLDKQGTRSNLVCHRRGLTEIQLPEENGHLGLYALGEEVVKQGYVVPLEDFAAPVLASEYPEVTLRKGRERRREEPEATGAVEEEWEEEREE
ncbi:hypothetical protein N7535_005324 [Penicillium sp. DV-2018c]|nr:hypothetical protein N7461_008905 [Penicillium sp. DV-2018c]KAJ5571664.1 hypothetical protein N7535_005324 [Penicillium sp. DV-2018c]